MNMNLPYYSIEEIKKLKDALLNSCVPYSRKDLLIARLAELDAKSKNSSYEVGTPPNLSGADPDEDAEDAILLHKWFKSAKIAVPRSVLSDERLWTALCHTTFANYMIRRWGSELPVPAEEGGESEADGEGLPKGHGRISGRFFVRGSSQRGVVRNGLARLYWAGELTCKGDDYSLTKEIFRKQDIHQNLLERSMCADSELLQGMLRKFQPVKTDALTKPRIQLVAKLVNGAGGTHTLDIVSAEDLGDSFAAVFPSK
jgi:hypothetical protein